MNVHEYQAKGLLRDFGVAVPEGILATTPAEAEAAAREAKRMRDEINAALESNDS